jgi:hypothetical protein
LEPEALQRHRAVTTILCTRCKLACSGSTLLSNPASYQSRPISVLIWPEGQGPAIYTGAIKSLLM